MKYRTLKCFGIYDKNKVRLKAFSYFHIWPHKEFNFDLQLLNRLSDRRDPRTRTRLDEKNFLRMKNSAKESATPEGEEEAEIRSRLSDWKSLEIAAFQL